MTKKSQKLIGKRFVWLFLAVIIGALLFLQVLGLLVASFTGLGLIYSTLFKYSVLINLLATILLYVAFKFARQNYLATLSKGRKDTVNKNNRVLRSHLSRSDYIFIAVITSITFLPFIQRNQNSRLNTALKSDSQKTTTEQWQDFKTETAKKSNYTSTPIYEADYYLGCFDDSGKPKGGFCLFNNDEYYVAEGDYRKYLRDILNHLTNNGYEFKENFLGGDDLNDYTDSFIETNRQQEYFSASLKNEELGRTILVYFSNKDKLENSLSASPVPQSVIDNIVGDPVIYILLYQQDVN